MKILIVDDEPLARQRIHHLLDSLGEHEVIGEAANGEQALMKAQKEEPDVVLMDIRMPGMDGLEASKYINRLPNPPAIIFTTAFSEHAIKAFDHHAVDYLLKPIKKERLQESLLAAKRLTKAQLTELSAEEQSNSREKICIKNRGSLELIPVSEIIYFKADQKYVTLRTEDHEYLIEESLKALEDEFEGSFIRVHRNALVSEKHIAGITKNESNHPCVSFSYVDDLLEISRRHLPDIRKRLKRMAG